MKLYEQLLSIYTLISIYRMCWQYISHISVIFLLFLSLFWSKTDLLRPQNN